jgi:hypothetical protein
MPYNLRYHPRYDAVRGGDYGLQGFVSELVGRESQTDSLRISSPPAQSPHLCYIQMSLGRGLQSDGAVWSHFTSLISSTCWESWTADTAWPWLLRPQSADTAATDNCLHAGQVTFYLHGGPVSLSHRYYLTTFGQQYWLPALGLWRQTAQCFEWRMARVVPLSMSEFIYWMTLGLFNDAVSTVVTKRSVELYS